MKQASRELLASIKVRLAELDRFWEKEQTQAEVEVFILERCSPSFPRRLYRRREEAVAGNVYAHVWQQAMNGELAMAD